MQCKMQCKIKILFYNCYFEFFLQNEDNLKNIGFDFNQLFQYRQPFNVVAGSPKRINDLITPVEIPLL